MLPRGIFSNEKFATQSDKDLPQKKKKKVKDLVAGTSTRSKVFRESQRRRRDHQIGRREVV